LDESGEEEDQEEIDAKRKAKQKRRIEKERRKEAKKIFMGDKGGKAGKKDELSHLYFGEKKSSGEEDLEDLDED
jgi:hypothetical protein